MRRSSLRAAAAGVLALAVLLAPLPAAARAEGRLTGVLRGVDGRPVPGHAVVVLDAEGQPIARGVASRSGKYAIPGIPRGRYALAVESPDGTRLPVLAPLTAIHGGRVQLDLRLVESGDETVGATASTGAWWGGLSLTGKAWVVTGVTTLAAIGVAGLDDDDEEPQASPFVPD